MGRLPFSVDLLSKVGGFAEGECKEEVGPVLFGVMKVWLSGCKPVLRNLPQRCIPGAITFTGSTEEAEWPLRKVAISALHGPRNCESCSLVLHQGHVKD